MNFIISRPVSGLNFILCYSENPKTKLSLSKILI
jgi:hypothetical protein